MVLAARSHELCGPLGGGGPPLCALSSVCSCLDSWGNHGSCGACSLASVVLVVTWRQDGESPTRGLVSLGGAPAHRGTRRDWEALLRISLWAWWRCTRVALWVRPTAAGEHEPLWSTIIRTWWSAVIRWVCRSIRAAPGTVAAATEPTAAEQCHAKRHERQCSLEELPDSVPVASRCISRMASISIASGVRAI